jgi:hypothetical protein
MAKLVIISETGMFHSACKCIFSNRVEWYGFKPKTSMSPAGDGFVDESDRSAMVNHSITFNVAEDVLDSAVVKAWNKYINSTYVVTVRDCVSFSADMARYVGLSVPAVNITPWGLIQILAVWNDYESKN